MNAITTTQIISFIFIFITSILYFTKRKVYDKENIFLSVLLIVTLVVLALEFLNNIFLLDSLDAFGHSIIHNTYDTFIIIWSTILFIYFLEIITPDSDIKDTQSSIVFKVVGICFFFLLISIIITFLPTGLKLGKYFYYESGIRLGFIYFVLGLYILVIDINIFLNKKNEIRKILPIILFQLLFFIGIIARNNIIPGDLVITSFVASIVVMMLTNTIDNQDIKYINELTAAKQETEKATRAKSDFLSSMSHEIRTPLNAIIGLSELIYERDDINESVREDLKDISYASQTLLEIVGNILDINKIESNKMEIQNMNYFPTEIVEELVKMNKVRIGKKDIKLVSTISSDVPYELVGDKIHIKQIINNLLSNAIKYTDKGQVELNLFAKNDGFVSNLIIQVKDTGKGIKASDYDKLFNKFERLDTEINSTIEGSGLGLAITKRLVQLLNGQIRVQSTYGQGSIFEVTIPQTISMMINPKQVELEYKIEQMEAGNYDATVASLKKVLICDDSQINLKIASQNLKGENVQVDTCLSGREALDLVKKNKYDIIFLDLKMPNMDGFKTLDEMKKIKDFKTPVIAFTAVEEEIESICLNAGFSGFLIKPFTKDQIVNKFNEVVKNYNAIRNTANEKVIEKTDDGIPDETETPPISELPTDESQVVAPVQEVNATVDKKPETPVVQTPAQQPAQQPVQAPQVQAEVKKEEAAFQTPVSNTTINPTPALVQNDTPAVNPSSEAPKVESKEEPAISFNNQDNSNIQPSINFDK